ncbi:MAG TPA: hypothetical protein V6C97_18515 [Oculatellaceae cyanobacterium]
MCTEQYRTAEGVHDTGDHGLGEAVIFHIILLRAPSKALAIRHRVGRLSSAICIPNDMHNNNAIKRKGHQ